MYSFIIFILLLFNFSLNEAIQVTVKEGILEGISSKSRNGTEYYSFFGIPFAKPPLGKLRFEPPKEPDSWKGVRSAKTHPPMCIQTDTLSLHLSANPIDGQEDCLYLNVFTPNVSFSSLLPVMVYIHGGAYFSGEASVYSPEYFMDHPVVVVVIQYRLGILGFVSAADEILPGNYGMKDQVAALKWVQTNIDKFGGDPKRVTIVGESAGGSSVHFHLHSPLSSGLFHQAIGQSGSALSVWTLTPSQRAKERARALGVLSGCPILETKELVECLREVPAEELVFSYNKFQVWDVHPIIPFAIVVEPKNVPGAFLVEDPWKQHVVNNVPLITGVTRNEGGIMVTKALTMPTLMDQWALHYKRLLPLAFFYVDWIDQKNTIAITTALKNFYFGDENISAKTGKKLMDMFTDGFFAADCIEAAQRHRSSNKVYFYLYDHRNVHTFNELFGNVTEDLGVCHADDLLSLFHVQKMFPKVNEGPDLVVSHKMINYWINFIYKGDPNGEQEIWKPVQSQNLEYLHIRTDSDVMEEKLFNDRYNLWKKTLFSFRPTLNANKLKGEL